MERKTSKIGTLVLVIAFTAMLSVAFPAAVKAEELPPVDRNGYSTEESAADEVYENDDEYPVAEYPTEEYPDDEYPPDNDEDAVFGDEDDELGNLYALYTPSVSISSNGILQWSLVDGALGYGIYANGVNQIILGGYETAFDLNLLWLPEGVHQIQVRAISYTDDFANSELSEAVVFVVVAVQSMVPPAATQNPWPNAPRRGFGGCCAWWGIRNF